MLMQKNGNLRFAQLAALLTAALLAGCTASNDTTDDRIGRLMVSPGKYMIYTCKQLAGTIAGTSVREKQLEALMAKAGSGAGSVVTLVGYRPEYMQVRGELYEMRQAAAAKNCDAPGAQKPGAR